MENKTNLKERQNNDGVMLQFFSIYLCWQTPRYHHIIIIIVIIYIFADLLTAVSSTLPKKEQHIQLYDVLPAIRENAATASFKCLLTPFWQLLPPQTCPPAILQLKNTIYLLYDVNLSEGFNLRRDVYIRLAVFVHQLRKRGAPFDKVRLVLPPWPRLYHWHSRGLQQNDQPWSAFFDLESMRRYAPVLDFNEFLEEYSYFGLPESPYVRIEQVYRLIHFDAMLENGIFHDKYEIVNGNCSESVFQGGPLLRQLVLRYTHYNCMRFQGSASLLERVLRQAIREYDARNAMSTRADVKVFAILGAETILHDHWGDQHFWRARRSMRFAAHLVHIAKEFRRTQLKISDEQTRVQRPTLWELERSYRGARGGDYLCAHLRRGDFMQGRQSTTPTLRSAATQIKDKMRAFNLSVVFVATDATPFEIMELKEQFCRQRFVHYTTAKTEERELIKDGGIAIVDQLICAYARHFIGTYESTFTYRIYEEREILGFKHRSTFNTLCKHALLDDCARNTVWQIVYN